MSDTIQLKLTAQQRSTKLAWTGNEWAVTYCVNHDVLQQACQNVRGELAAVAESYQRPEPTYAGHLDALAFHGAALRTALFTPEGNKPLQQELLDYLDTQPPGSPLKVFSDADVQVPFNFVYCRGEFDKPTFNNEIGDFRDFWACRFDINNRYIGTDIPPGKPSAERKAKTLFALHESRFNAAARLLERDPSMADKIDTLLRHDVGSSGNWKDCKTKWDSIRDDDSILYIFAHSDGRCLHLKDESPDDRNAYLFQLDSNRFRMLFTKPAADRSRTLCFINGCRTNDGEFGNGFLSVTSQHGFHGFIGSEAEISNEWATRYAVEFLHKMLDEGKSVGEAYGEMRAGSCFPLSLWYTCCASPSFRVAAETCAA